MRKNLSVSVLGVITLLCFGILPACTSSTGNQNNSQSGKADSTIQKVQTQEAISLFNGKNMDGWHTFNKDSADPCWHAENGVLTLDPDLGGGGTLITDNTYENFILTLDWKISPEGNSGILVNVIEDLKYDHAYLTAPEMQVLDNKDAEDNKDSTHLAGSLYDMIACNPDNVNPAGEWNKVKIKQNNGDLTFWINEHKVANVQIGSQEWKERIADSKFSGVADFGKSKKGHIGLQDHGHKVSYKNIKIQVL